MLFGSGMQVDWLSVGDVLSTTAGQHSKGMYGMGHVDSTLCTRAGVCAPAGGQHMHTLNDVQLNCGCLSCIREIPPKATIRDKPPRHDMDMM